LDFRWGNLVVIKLPRRRLLYLSVGAVTCALGARSGASDTGKTSDSQMRSSLPEPAEAPFDTVVVLMMENRSFDHLLGWLPGANGRQRGIVYRDKEGIGRETWPLAPDFQGCHHLDPDHTWEGIRDQYAGGRCDGFLRTPSAKLGDLFPIGYYREGDLPILGALAKGYTTFDNYFCSMMGPTWENRLYQLTGTTQIMDNCDYPKDAEARPVAIQTTIFDRVREAGLAAGYYYHASPITKLFQSRKYDDISYPIERFWADAREGNLANVVFIDPDYSDLAEDMGTSNDYHPWSNLLAAEGFVAQVHDAVKKSPQWNRMVFVLNFDEHGGFFDHVAPPACEDDTEVAGPDLKRLGFRVPAIAMGPFAPRKIEKAGPYEHCSILKMIEWRWGLAPLRVRDRQAKNLAEALDFTIHREAINLPSFLPPEPAACWEGGGWMELAVARDGWVRVLVDIEDSRGAEWSGRLLAGGDVLAVATGQAAGQSQSVPLAMRLNGAGRRLLASSSNRLPALLETIVKTPNGSACRSTSPVLLRNGSSGG
jgi:phospholipase C